MKLTIIRHATTEANKKRLFNGQYDEDLSEEGFQDLPKIVEKLHNFDFDVIIASTLKRAVQSATPICIDHNITLRTDPRIVELNAGSFTMQPTDSLKGTFGMIMPDLLDTYDYDFNDFGGENSHQVKKRVESFLKDVRSSDARHVLIVTHGGIIRWLHYLITGEKMGVSKNLAVHEYDDI